MAHAVHAPRINNNDDTVTIVRIAVGAGDFVRRGDLILEVETEKAAVTVEAEHDGYVLALRCRESDVRAVGAVVAWLGDTPDEVAPGAATEAFAAADTAAHDLAAEGVTAKARLLLGQHGLDAGVVPRRGPRLLAADVAAYLAARSAAADHDQPAPAKPTSLPARADLSALPAPTDLGALPASADLSALPAPAYPTTLPAPANSGALPAPADLAPLRPGERATLATVTWQRDHAAPAFLEIEYDPRPWREHGATFSRDRRLLLDPTLALMAHRLALLAAATGVNGTILEQPDPCRVRYRHVNLGFTVQAREVLYLCVVQQADTLDAADFVARLGASQRRAMAHRLEPAEGRGATVGFTSMARWGVQRHIPVLPPYCALMVAHGNSFDGGARAILGVTYDHRILSGFAAVRLLRLLADPASDIPNLRI